MKIEKFNDGSMRIELDALNGDRIEYKKDNDGFYSPGWGNSEETANKNGLSILVSKYDGNHYIFDAIKGIVYECVESNGFSAVPDLNKGIPFLLFPLERDIKTNETKEFAKEEI